MVKTRSQTKVDDDPMPFPRASAPSPELTLSRPTDAALDGTSKLLISKAKAAGSRRRSIKKSAAKQQNAKPAVTETVSLRQDASNAEITKQLVHQGKVTKRRVRTKQAKAGPLSARSTTLDSGTANAMTDIDASAVKLAPKHQGCKRRKYHQAASHGLDGTDGSICDALGVAKGSARSRPQATSNLRAAEIDLILNPEMPINPPDLPEPSHLKNLSFYGYYNRIISGRLLVAATGCTNDKQSEAAAEAVRVEFRRLAAVIFAQLDLLQAIVLEDQRDRDGQEVAGHDQGRTWVTNLAWGANSRARRLARRRDQAVAAFDAIFRPENYPSLASPEKLVRFGAEGLESYRTRSSESLVGSIGSQRGPLRIKWGPVLAGPTVPADHFGGLGYTETQQWGPILRYERLAPRIYRHQEGQASNAPSKAVGHTRRVLSKHDSDYLDAKDEELVEVAEALEDEEHTTRPTRGRKGKPKQPRNKLATTVGDRIFKELTERMSEDDAVLLQKELFRQSRERQTGMGPEGHHTGQPSQSPKAAKRKEGVGRPSSAREVERLPRKRARSDKRVQETGLP